MQQKLIKTIFNDKQNELQKLNRIASYTKL